MLINKNQKIAYKITKTTSFLKLGSGCCANWDSEVNVGSFSSGRLLLDSSSFGMSVSIALFLLK